MKTRVLNLSAISSPVISCIRAALAPVFVLVGRARAASRPVKATVAAELAVLGVLAYVGWGRLRPVLDRVVDLDQLPPWPLLGAFPAVGAAAALVRMWRPDEPLRRWQGVALRRVDERLG